LPNISRSWLVQRSADAAALSTGNELAVSEFAKTTADKLIAATRELGNAKNRYSEFSALRDESANLAQRLRMCLADSRKGVRTDTCPLVIRNSRQENWQRTFRLVSISSLKKGL